MTHAEIKFRLRLEQSIKPPVRVIIEKTDNQPARMNSAIEVYRQQYPGAWSQHHSFFMLSREQKQKVQLRCLFT